MDDGLDKIINDRLAEALRDSDQKELTPHAGLELAQVLAQVPEGNIAMLMDVMRAAVKEMDIRLDTAEHQALLDFVSDKKIIDHAERQQYFRELFALCVANSNKDHVATAENDVCVYPTSASVTLR